MGAIRAAVAAPVAGISLHVSGRVSAALLELELEGRVRQIEGKRFVRVGRA